MWQSPTPASVASCNCYLCRPKPPQITYLPRPASRAPLEDAYYIVAVSGGTVLSKQPDGLFAKDASNSDSQRWRVEYEDDQAGNRVALLNVADGKWLRAFSGAAYGRVDTSDEKQWWVMEEGGSPGSCWLRCGDFADAYLCNANGSFVDGNATFTRPKQVDRAHALTWTLRDADAKGYDAKGWRISVLDDLRVVGKELEERERVAAEKERGFLERETRLWEKEIFLRGKEKSLLEKENGLREKEGGLRETEVNLNEKESSLLEQERQSTARSSRHKTKEDELLAREAELQQLSVKFTITENAQQEQTDDLALRESQLTESRGTMRDIALLKAENDNLYLQLRTSSLETKVEKARQKSASLSNTEQLRNLEAEKARLRVLLHAQQQKAKASPASNKSRDSPTVFNSPSSLAIRSMKDTKTSKIGRSSPRAGSSSGSKSKPTAATSSITATPSPSSRYNNTRDPPSTPIRASAGAFSSTSNTQRSYDSRFSGWPEDDFSEPVTPTKSSKRATPSPLRLSALLGNNCQTRLSKDNLLSSNPGSRRVVSSQLRSPNPGSSITQTPSVSSTGGKATSKSTSTQTQPPRIDTLKSGAPDGMLPIRDDGDVLIYACGHKVFKPPRKLNRTIVGYLYE